MQASHQRALTALDRRGRLRALSPRSGLDFSSNDYLGLAASGALRQAAAAALSRGVAIGSTGSRLLRGNDPEIETLEAEAADFFGAETALFFSGGYQANVAVLATLPARGDLIVYDELAHASMHEGIAASKAAALPARHNGVGDVEEKINSWRQSGGTGKVWIAVESLYSMDGDCAPLKDLWDAAIRHDAMLIVDEAHATGIFGPGGRGLAHSLEGRDNVITVHTCGKALGAMGALVLLPALQRDFLINRAKSFIYSTAPSPLMAAIVRHALKLCAQSDAARDALQERIKVAKSFMQGLLSHDPAETQIQPVIVGSDARAVAIAESLQQQGFDVRAVRPPTVPEGTSRLRIALTLNVEESDIEAMFQALSEVLKRSAP